MRPERSLCPSVISKFRVPFLLYALACGYLGMAGPAKTIPGPTFDEKLAAVSSYESEMTSLELPTSRGHETGRLGVGEALPALGAVMHLTAYLPRVPKSIPRVA